MSRQPYDQLQKVGIDEELAYQVSVFLDPDYIASKKDILVMQEAILQMQMQMRTDQNFHKLRNEIADVRMCVEKTTMNCAVKSVLYAPI